MSRESDSQRLALVIAKSLEHLPSVRFKADEGKIVARVAAVLDRSFTDEAALHEEAERLAASHARQLLGMDRDRIVRGIMERLARERNFPL
jgi:hypothetical protein